MSKSVLCLRSIGVRVVTTALFLSLVSGPESVGFAAGPSPTPTNGVSTGTYPVPNYTQAKLPAISSCDPKAADDDSVSTGDLPATGNTYLDAVTSTATKLTKKYGKSNRDGTEDEDDEGDVNGNATLDTDCDKERGTGADKLGIDAEKLQCGVVNRTVPPPSFIDEMTEKKESSKKYLACKRGVLDALRGEIGCFKKQIADAEGYMNELVNGQGGLAGMLSQATEQLTQIDQEVQDRQSQYDSANQRIEGGEGGNPPGLRQAKDAITKLAADLPRRLTQVNQAVANQRLQEQRFNSLVQQVELGKALKCMNTPSSGYHCVKPGTTSVGHPDWNGAVSPFTYLQCLYSQSANKVVGGSVVKNANREASYLNNAKSQIDQALKDSPTLTDLPQFSDAAGYLATMKTYPIKTTADLGKVLAPLLRDMDAATGKNMTSQFWGSLNTCLKAASDQVAKDRQDPNSTLKADQVALTQGAEKTRSENSSAFRELRDSYLMAVKAATGQSLDIDTSKCENASLEDQAKCFDALNAMNDSLLTGRVTAPSSSLTGPALALTNGQDPIHGFSGALAAKNNPQRTIPVQCGGIDDCLTKYTNLRTQLKQTVEERKQFKTTFQNNVNSRLLMTAKDLASKGVAGGGAAGVQPGMVTLNSVSAGIAQRKAQLETAMSKFGVDAGLDLDPKEVKEPEKDEGTGLYKPSDLRNLVLAEITPGLPDTNSKGFTDATKSIGERDKELTKLQDAIDTDFAAIQSKQEECAKTAKDANCKTLNDAYTRCCDDQKNDAVSKLKIDIDKATDTYLSQGKSATDAEALARHKLGDTTNLKCGGTYIAGGTCPEVDDVNKACLSDSAKLNTNSSKDAQKTDDRKGGPPKKAGDANG